MLQPATTRLQSLSVTAVGLLTAAAFAAACGQAPLYYSNQHQYFLHGLAKAGHGLLHEDWLANTLDPTPLFSALVAFTARFLHPWCFHAYYGLLLAAYAAALLGLFAALAGGPVAARRWPVFAALLVLVHAAAIRWCSYHWLGQDYPWYLQAGVAGQYILGGMFQPSVFGILLVVAISLFVWDRPLLAAGCLAAANVVHVTYLLPAALLTLGFIAALAGERRYRLALGVAALALVLVLPITAYTLLTFGPTSPEVFAEAQDILMNVRIPHHARPDLWLDEIAVFQIAWVVLGMALTWRTRLFPILAVPFVLAVLLTLAQVATGSQALALLFPWRISAVLVPVATTVVLSRLVAIPALPLDGTAARRTSAVTLVVLAVAGVWISVGRLAYYMADEELPLLDFVERTKAPGDVYFLPVRVPDLAATTRGSLSSDFKPLPDKRQDTRVIPVDLQRFRLATGAPLFVDFKSIPYKDTEVLAWRDRLRLAEEVQEQIRQGRFSEALTELRDQGVTHVIVPAKQELTGAGFHQVHEDPCYRVYRLTAVPEDGS
ncbi:MAG: hypothetical protein L0Z62_40670 [Gemmataceae bacterium]|nr:hypothetical protein [Gemmataceae bacterium]